MAPKPDFGTIVATTGQAAEHIAVACQYGAWKIAVTEQSPGVLRAVVGWGEAGRETEPGDELPEGSIHATRGNRTTLWAKLCRRTRTLGDSVVGYAAERAPLLRPNERGKHCSSEGNVAAAAFPDASTSSGARAPFLWFGLVRGLIGHRLLIRGIPLNLPPPLVSKSPKTRGGQIHKNHDFQKNSACGGLQKPHF